MNLPLHHQLGAIGALFCLIALGVFCAEIIREVRFNREMKRRRLNAIFDGVRPHRKWPRKTK